MDVSIVTPEEAVWEGQAELVIARSPEGEFGIMFNHIPFLAALVPGLVTVVSGGSRQAFVVPGGFLEAARDPEGDGTGYHVIVLADEANEAGDVDAAEARRLIEEAKAKREDVARARADASRSASSAS